MSNDSRNAEFSFLDFASAKRAPGPADHSKNGSTAAEDECGCTERARPDIGAYLVLALAFLTYGGIAWAMGWL